jgi:hypothetical protein
MAAPQRIYRVANALVEDAATGGAFTRLVRAPNAAQALRHVATDTLSVAVASQDDLVELIEAGVKVESVREQATEEA